jgi:predicted HAD superfamily Cof-like phosphohydrolase
MTQEKETQLLEALDDFINEQGLIVASPAKIIDALKPFINTEQSAFEQVTEFCQMMGQVVEYNAQFPSKEVIDLRIGLINEELKELKGAIEENDIVEVADALADLLYVTYGTACAFGLTSILRDIQNAVHFSNMSKVCLTEEEAKQTVEKYNKDNVGYTSYAPRFGYYVVYRVSDNKVLKSINYKPVNLKPIIDSVKVLGRSL